ncbi:MAG: GTPase ObgE [Candidatus Microgenomates bacterium]|jgi:GTP-binding protein
MLIDTAEVIFRGGHGGPGITSFGKKEHSGPDGGNGGRGGDIYVVATSDLTLLNQFSRKTLFIAGNGEGGGKNKMAGLDGKDMEIFLPFGTSIIDKESGRTIYELDKIGDRKLLCFGGLGGRGNYEFRSSVKQAPKYHQPGLEGDEKKLILSLKLIADFGFVGLPNSGKSSLLNELTRAHAKIAAYPFTTLSPNLGVCEGEFLADIPGLIEGASEGKGLGIRFLKHIEKVGVILHCISSESTDLIKDYDIVRSEMGKYSPELLKKTEVVLLTKTDLVDKDIIKSDIKRLKTEAKKVMAVSIHDWKSIKKLNEYITGN